MSNAAKKILADYARRREIEAEAETPEPFLDHRVYRQGWTYAMIQREAARRYRSVRDEERKQDWTWAINEPVVRKLLTEDAVRNANKLYESKQVASGDIDREEESVRVDFGFHYLGESWAQERARAIVDGAESYVRAHPEASPARLAVFEHLFDIRQPTLEEIRIHARPDGMQHNAKGKVIRLNQREVIKRIVWCCELLADRDLDFARLAGGGRVAA